MSHYHLFLPCGRSQKRVRNVGSSFGNAETVVQQLTDLSRVLKATEANPELQRAFLIARVRRIEQGKSEGGGGFRIQLNFPDVEGSTKWAKWLPRLDSNQD